MEADKITGTRPPPQSQFLKNETKISYNNWSPTFLSYDSDNIENDASNNSSLPRERVYRAVA
jgi:hypothetical protein